MNNKKNTKKETAAVVYKKVSVALADIKGHVKQKRFDKQVQKLSNILAQEIADAADKALARLEKKKKLIKKAGKKAAGKKAGKKTKALQPLNGLPLHTEERSAENAQP